LKIYCRHPFNTSSKVSVTQGCKPDHQGAKDLNFVGMPYGTPVFAMESGVVADVRQTDPIVQLRTGPDMLIMLWSEVVMGSTPNTLT
jgi:hypothetical protein